MRIVFTLEGCMQPQMGHISAAELDVRGMQPHQILWQRARVCGCLGIDWSLRLSRAERR